MESPAITLEHFAADNTSPGVELIYASHSSWPLAPETPDTNYCHGHSLALSVLDSSFNPPTAAHLALARLFREVSDDRTSTTTSRSFDAKLLLFSVKNADKTLKAGDATPSQRLQMMALLARELQSIGEQSGDHGSQNIAVAVCKEPTFVGKSAALKVFLRSRILALTSAQTQIQLTFLLGFDTLERLFNPKYYDSAGVMEDALRRFLSTSGDDSRIICAHRTSGASYSQVDTSVLEKAAEFINSGAVVLTDIGEADRTLSSSEVREGIRNCSDEWKSKVPAAVAAYIKENRLYA